MDCALLTGAFEMGDPFYRAPTPFTAPLSGILCFHGQSSSNTLYPGLADSQALMLE